MVGHPSAIRGIGAINHQTREIAQKSEPVLLEVVYDFIYRLTSGAVHFNPQVLLRLGWGPYKPSGGILSDVTYSTKKLSHYYLGLSQVYGTYLLCLYFELFDEYLMLGEEENDAVVDIREHLFHILRWPEMVTFEEMNKHFPENTSAKNFLFGAAYAAFMVSEGFVAGAEKLLMDKR